jgi:ParB/RepB/Spo0J family partition protein
MTIHVLLQIYLTAKGVKNFNKNYIKGDNIRHKGDDIMISTSDESGQQSEMQYLAINKLDQNPQQPRFGANDKKMVALADSVKMYGVLEPVLVCRRDGNYTLIAGHRRFVAAIMAGLEEIPARILSSEFSDYLGAAVSENMLREGLNTLEVAMALNELAHSGADRKTLCAISGLSSSSVSELLRLKVIPREVCMECVENNDTTKRFLIQLSRYTTGNEIHAAYQYFLEHKQLPARQKRSYASSKQMNKPLELLTLLNKSINEADDIDYMSESVTNNMFRMGIGSLLENLKKHGWFLPQKFDMSNGSVNQIV